MERNRSETKKQERGCGATIQELTQTLNNAGYRFDRHQVEQFQLYQTELFHWNKKINLTSINKQDFISHHLLDSLSVIDDLKGNRILDVGTGGGLPGVPLAIANPEKSFTLLDARNKKIQFLEHIKSKLRLVKIYPQHQRAEDYQPDSLYETVVTRAFSSLAVIYRLAKPLIADSGRMIVMKGRYPEQELSELHHMQVNYEVKSVAVFGLDAERHLIIIDNE